MRSALFLLLPTLLILAACGRHSAFENSMAVSEEAKLKMFKEPTDVLTPTTPPAVKDLNEYSVYRLVEAKFGADVHAQSVSASIKVESSAGVEAVDLVGALRPDGTSSLVDLNPLPEGKNRLVAEAICVDIGTCKQIILNVYYKVAGKTHKVQFSTPSLHADPAKKDASEEKVDNSRDGAEAHPTERNLPKEKDESEEALGDFVGAPRNEILIGKLWERSKSPELPPVLSRADDPQLKAANDNPTPVVEKPHPTRVTTTTPTSPPLAPKAPQAAPKPQKIPAKTQKPAAPKPSPESQGLIERWLKAAGEWLVLPIKKAEMPVKPRPAPVPKPPTQKPVDKPAEKPATRPKTSAPAAKPSKPTPPVMPTPAPAPTQPDPTKPKPQPATPPGKEEKAAPPETPAYPFPPAKPNSDDQELDQRINALEAKLAPLMNLRDGGVSRGGYSTSTKDGIRSAIVNASLLPSNIPGLVPVVINKNAHYGSGMLVSFLENVATYLFKQLGLKLYVGDMSLKHGGSFGPSSDHNTHQNGLDADIAWIGAAHPLRDSILDSRGRVVDGFDYEKTWNFLKVAARQEIIQDAQKSTAVSRIYMSPAVKDGFCSWAKERNLLDNELDSELMRLVRRTPGHYKHFHLSLKCSPHYPFCRNMAGPPESGPGC